MEIFLYFIYMYDIYIIYIYITARQRLAKSLLPKSAIQYVRKEKKANSNLFCYFPAKICNEK